MGQPERIAASACDQQAANAPVAVEKRVNGFKLRVDERHLDHGWQVHIKPETPARRASANSAKRLRSENTTDERAGSTGGKACGTNACTGSPKVVEIA
jgi:hypothetical protein